MSGWISLTTDVVGCAQCDAATDDSRRIVNKSGQHIGWLCERCYASTMFKVEPYVLYAANGRRVRVATQVTLPSGKVVRFMERLSRREALAQVEASLTDAEWWNELEAYSA